MALATKRIAWSATATAPIDLAADEDVGLAPNEPGESRRNVAFVAIQNVSTRTVRWAEQPDAPAATATDVGHSLAPGAGVVVMLVHGRAFWLWSPGSGVVAVSPGAPAPVYTDGPLPA